MSTSDDSTTKSKSVQDLSAAARLTAQTFDPQAPGAKPDQPQCDPGQKDYRVYAFRDGAGVVVARMLVPRVSGALDKVAYARGTEYWFDVSTTPPSRSLTITWEDHFWNDTTSPVLGRLSFTMSQAPTWAPNASPPAACATSFVGSSLVIAWNLQMVGGVWQGALEWFNTSGSSDAFSGIMPVGGVTLVANTSVRSFGWFGAAVRPV